MSSKLNSLKTDIIGLLEDGNLSEETIELVFMEFEATHTISIVHPNLIKNMDDAELKTFTDNMPLSKMNYPYSIELVKKSSTMNLYEYLEYMKGDHD